MTKDEEKKIEKFKKIFNRLSLTKEKVEAILERELTNESWMTYNSMNEVKQKTKVKLEKNTDSREMTHRKQQK